MHRGPYFIKWGLPSGYPHWSALSLILMFCDSRLSVRIEPLNNLLCILGVGGNNLLAWLLSSSSSLFFFFWVLQRQVWDVDHRLLPTCLLGLRNWFLCLASVVEGSSGILHYSCDWQHFLLVSVLETEPEPRAFLTFGRLSLNHTFHWKHLNFPRFPTLL